MNDKPFFFDLDEIQLKAFLRTLGLPEYRSRQLWQAFYVDLVENINQVSTLSKDLRTTLKEKMDFGHLTPAKRLVSSDRQTVKTLFSLPDGLSSEAVLMHYDERQT